MLTQKLKCADVLVMLTLNRRCEKNNTIIGSHYSKLCDQGVTIIIAEYECRKICTDAKHGNVLVFSKSYFKCQYLFYKFSHILAFSNHSTSVIMDAYCTLDIHSLKQMSGAFFKLIVLRHIKGS